LAGQTPGPQAPQAHTRDRAAQLLRANAISMSLKSTVVDQVGSLLGFSP